MVGYYTTAELAKLLGISRIAIFKKIQKGQIKATKFGRNYLIRKQDVLESVSGELSKSQKEFIAHAVKKSMQEYGEALELLSKE